MDQKISFIPKKSIAKTKRRRRPFNLFLFLSFVIFFLTLGAYGGALYFERTIDNRLSIKNSELEEVKNRLDPENVIERARELDVKIKSVNTLLGDHRALSPLFDTLEEITLASVYFTKLDFSEGVDEGVNTPVIRAGQQTSVTPAGGLRISMNGVAPSYSSLALQLDALRVEPSFKGIELLGMNLDTKGSILFSVDMVIDTKLVSYTNTLSGGGFQENNIFENQQGSPVGGGNDL